MAENKEAEMNELDLYDDLIDPFFSLQKQEDNGGESDADSCNEDHQAELMALQTRNHQLSITNNALKKNISCLFKTATMEVERKSAEITSLKKQVNNLQQLVKHISGKLASAQAPHSLPHFPTNSCLVQDQLMPLESSCQTSSSQQTQQLSHNKTLQGSFGPSPKSRTHSHHSTRVCTPSHSRQNSLRKRMPAKAILGEDASGPGRAASPSFKFTPTCSDSPLPENSLSEMPFSSQLREEGEVSDSSTGSSSHTSHRAHHGFPGRETPMCQQDHDHSFNHRTRHRSRSPLHNHTHSKGSDGQYNPSRAHPIILSHRKDSTTRKRYSDRRHRGHYHRRQY